MLVKFSKGNLAGSSRPYSTLVAALLLAYLAYQAGSSILARLGYESRPSGEGRTARALMAPGPAPKGLIAVGYRLNISEVLQQEGMKVGAELGVQIGKFARHTLRTWTACEKYYLVDIWKHQENYNDGANVDNKLQESRYQIAQKNLKPWENKTVFLRMFTSEAVNHIPDDSLDFLYVDARHDYCGVKEDLESYWPKVKRGGIIAGHDYLNVEEVKQRILQLQDWGLCQDGTRNEGAVKGAVNEFATKHGLQLMVTYNEPMWPSWMARKP